jgi:hypothetical protein
MPERVVACWGLSHRTPLGEYRDAELGDTVVLSEAEQARLEALKALAPPGATRASVLQEAQARQDTFTAERRSSLGPIFAPA